VRGKEKTFLGEARTTGSGFVFYKPHRSNRCQFGPGNRIPMAKRAQACMRLS